MREKFVQEGQLPLTSHKVTPVTAPLASHPRPTLREALHRVDWTRHSLPARGRYIKDGDPDLCLHQLVGHRTHQYGPRRRQML